MSDLTEGGWRYIAARGTVNDVYSWSIRELFIIDGQPVWTASASDPYGETLEELKADLSFMAGDVGRGWLDMDTGEVHE